MYTNCLPGAVVSGRLLVQLLAYSKGKGNVKTHIQLALLAVAVTTQAQEINLTNRLATFTNLEGRVYKTVHLVKATAEGVIWKEDGSVGGGLVNYTNLAPGLIESWGIPPERVEMAKARAAAKAQAAAALRGQSEADAAYVLKHGYH